MKLKKLFPADKPGIIAALGVFVMLGVFPLFVTEAYFNITISKYIFFTVSSAIFFALCLIARIAGGNPIDLSKLNPKNSQISFPDIAMLLFLAVSLVSCLTSSYQLASLSGIAGRRMGLVMAFALTFAYFFISKFYSLRKHDTIIFGAVFAFLCAIALIQSLGFDPFGLYEGVPETSKVNFVAFIGNVNVFSSFVSIGAGLTSYMYCKEKDKNTSIFWLAVAAFSYFGLFTANSDSTYVAFAVMFALLAIIASKEKESFERFFILLFMLFFTAGIFTLLRRLKGEGVYELPALTTFLTDLKTVLIGLAASAVAVILVRLIRLPEKAYPVIQKILIAFVILGAVSVAGIFIYFSWINTEADLGALENHLRFSLKWGTNRGFVWTRLLEAFGDFPLSKKLIGYGPDTIQLILQDAFGADGAAARPGFHFDNAHNDFIQYLTTIGIAGLASYVMLLITAVYSCIKSESLTKKALAFAIIIFVAQSVFNITQPITTPLLFVFIAMTQSKCEE